MTGLTEAWTEDMARLFQFGFAASAGADDATSSKLRLRGSNPKTRTTAASVPQHPDHHRRHAGDPL